MLETENSEEINQVRKSLELFMRYQRADGKIPRKIALDFNGLKYLGFKIRRPKPRPIYTSPIPFFYSTDNDLLFVIAFCKYIDVTGDLDFANKMIARAEKALLFYGNAGLMRGGLIFERVSRIGWIRFSKADSCCIRIVCGMRHSANLKFWREN